MVKARLPLHESVTVIPGFFDLTHVRNTGAAFGMLNNIEFAYKPAVMVARRARRAAARWRATR